MRYRWGKDFYRRQQCNVEGEGERGVAVDCRVTTVKSACNPERERES